MPRRRTPSRRPSPLSCRPCRENYTQGRPDGESDEHPSRKRGGKEVDRSSQYEADNSTDNDGNPVCFALYHIFLTVSFDSSSIPFIGVSPRRRSTPTPPKHAGPHQHCRHP